jgi:multisubunit Na+/H+ antiporter MnhF subunit
VSKIDIKAMGSDKAYAGTVTANTYKLIAGKRSTSNVYGLNITTASTCVLVCKLIGLLLGKVGMKSRLVI